MVITDLPYNVPIAGHVSGKARARHREFATESGEMSPAEFTAFLCGSLKLAAEASVEGSCHFVFMDWCHLEELPEAGRGIYTQLFNLCVWVKTNGGMGSLYRSQHELVLVYRHGQGKHVNNVELGRNGRNRTIDRPDVGMSSFQSECVETLGLHPTIKPTALIAEAILDCSHWGGTMLDPFRGSGTTILAADRTGRRASVMELDPRYIDISIYRFVKETGRPAINAWSGQTVGPSELPASGNGPVKSRTRSR